MLTAGFILKVAHELDIDPSRLLDVFHRIIQERPR